MVAVALETVFACIEAASNGASPPGEQQAAMKVLESYNEAAGFVSALVQILQEHVRVGVHARILAAICLKNVVKKCWKAKHSMPNAYVVGAEEKAVLRAFCGGQRDTGYGYLEPDRQVQVHIAELTAQLMRKDWPGDWPDGVHKLWDAAQSSDGAVQAAAMYRLYAGP